MFETQHFAQSLTWKSHVCTFHQKISTVKMKYDDVKSMLWCWDEYKDGWITTRNVASLQEILTFVNMADIFRWFHFHITKNTIYVSYLGFIQRPLCALYYLDWTVSSVEHICDSKSWSSINKYDRKIHSDIMVMR